MAEMSMAIRNIFRYKRRSLITASAIAFGVMFSIFLDGFIAGSENETTRNIRDYETGEAKIYQKGYFPDRDRLPFDAFLEPQDRTAVEKALGNKPYAPRVNLTSELYFNEDFFSIPGSIAATITAVDPEKDASVFKTSKMVSAGRWLKVGDTGVVLGSWLAEDIKAKPGYAITLECRGRGGFYQTFDAEILGVVKTDDPIVNRNGVFMDLAYADTLLELAGAVTEYSVRFAGNPANAGKKTEEIAKDIGDSTAEIYSWDKVAESTMQLLRGQRGESAIYLFFIFIIAAVGITNTMLMAVMERRSEIGMLRALGFSSAKIRSLFLIEGFGIGLIGTIMGIVAGMIVNVYFIVCGMDFSSMLRGMDIGYRITGTIRSDWNPAGIIRIAVGALAISTFIAWFPSGKTLRKEVADILRK